MRASIILVPHLEHVGDTITLNIEVAGSEIVMAALPFTGGSAIGLSATDAWRRAAAGDG